MNETAEIEKHTILSRMAVSIYTMPMEALIELYQAIRFNPDSDAGGGQTQKGVKPVPGKDEDLSRPFIIARLFVLIRQLDKEALLSRLCTLKDPSMRWVRDYPRLPCFLLADFAVNGKAFRGCIRDISASGVCIETSADFEVGRELALCFTLSEGNSSLPFKIAGRVSRICPGGIGVQYEHITHYQRDIIHTLITRDCFSQVERTF
jgi:hypothetical protein